MRFLIWTGVPSTPRSMLSLTVVLGLGGKSRNVLVPNTFCESVSSAYPNSASTSYASVMGFVTHLSVGKVKVLPDPEDAVDLAVVQIEGRVTWRDEGVRARVSSHCKVSTSYATSRVSIRTSTLEWLSGLDG